MKILELTDNHPFVFIKQIKEWGEILLNFESKNKYQLLDEKGQELGYFYERGQGIFHFIKRMLLRSHRPLHVELIDKDKQLLLTLTRGFHWFFSDLKVQLPNGEVVGHIYRRFGLLHKNYDLVDKSGTVFAHVKSPMWRLWTFTVYDNVDNEIAKISKKWGGIFKEAFTDSDKFGVDFGKVTGEHRVILLASAISIDFDFFEDNQRN